MIRSAPAVGPGDGVATAGAAACVSATTTWPKGVSLPKMNVPPAPTVKLVPLGNAAAETTFSVPDKTLVPPL